MKIWETLGTNPKQLSENQEQCLGAMLPPPPQKK